MHSPCTHHVLNMYLPCTYHVLTMYFLYHALTMCSVSLPCTYRALIVHLRCTVYLPSTHHPRSSASKSPAACTLSTPPTPPAVCGPFAPSRYCRRRRKRAHTHAHAHAPCDGSRGAPRRAAPREPTALYPPPAPPFTPRKALGARAHAHLPRAPAGGAPTGSEG